MPKPTLHQTLNAVRGALESPDELDREDLDLLMSIHRDIERVLEATSEVARPQVIELEKGLRGAIQRFESSHPSLTTAFSSLVETLSALGI